MDNMENKFFNTNSDNMGETVKNRSLPKIPLNADSILANESNNDSSPQIVERLFASDKRNPLQSFNNDVNQSRVNKSNISGMDLSRNDLGFNISTFNTCVDKINKRIERMNNKIKNTKLVKPDKSKKHRAKKSNRKDKQSDKKEVEELEEAVQKNKDIIEELKSENSVLKSSQKKLQMDKTIVFGYIKSLFEKNKANEELISNAFNLSK